MAHRFFVWPTRYDSGVLQLEILMDPEILIRLAAPEPPWPTERTIDAYPVRIVINENALVALSIMKRSSDTQGSQGWVPETVYSVAYRGEQEWEGLITDLHLLSDGRRRNMFRENHTVPIGGTLNELHVWVGSGRKPLGLFTHHHPRPIVADNLAITATFH